MAEHNIGDRIYDGLDVYRVISVNDSRWLAHQTYTLEDSAGNTRTLSGLEISRFYKKFPSNFLYIFGKEGEDVVDQKGKVLSYKEVQCVSSDVDSAKAKSKLGEEYTLLQVKKLGKDW